MKDKIKGAIAVSFFLFIMAGIPIIKSVATGAVAEDLGEGFWEDESSEEETDEEKLLWQKKRDRSIEKRNWQQCYELTSGTGMKVAHAIYGKRHVKLKDANMAENICNELADDTVTPKNITRDDLNRIKTLDIGMTAKYDTIKDIQYCSNVLELRINMECESDINVLQEELEEILPELSNLKSVWLVAKEDVTWESIDFLENCTQIEDVYIENCKAADYSALKQCKSLQLIYMKETQIDSAEDITGLEDIEQITIIHAPLSQNESEYKKLKKAYPNALIWGRDDE